MGTLYIFNWGTSYKSKYYEGHKIYIVFRIMRTKWRYSETLKLTTLETCHKSNFNIRQQKLYSAIQEWMQFAWNYLFSWCFSSHIRFLFLSYIPFVTAFSQAFQHLQFTCWWLWIFTRCKYLNANTEDR
jgi:hypothetical protein